MADGPHSVGDILDRLDGVARQKPKVLLGDVVETLGQRSHGPFLLAPALVEISPVGAIPAVPTLLAMTVILFAGQMVLGRKHLWLPGFLARRGADSKKTRKAIAKLRPVGERMDRWFHGRLPTLTTEPFVRIAAAGSILLALSVPALEFIPFASSAPMAAIAAFGLALLVRDGLLMIIALLLAGGAAGLGINLLLSRAG